MYALMGTLVSIAVFASLLGEGTVKLEKVLASIIVKVDERRELEDAVVTGATGGEIQTARVRILERLQWRELRTIVPFLYQGDALPKKLSKELNDSLKLCHEVPKVKDSTVPLTMGLEMGIAPTPDQIKKYQRELSQCLYPSLPEGLAVGTIDFNIRTEDRGWNEQVQNDQRGYRKP